MMALYISCKVGPVLAVLAVHVVGVGQLEAAAGGGLCMGAA